MSNSKLAMLMMLFVIPLISGCGAHAGSHQGEVGFAPTSGDMVASARTSDLLELVDQLAIEGGAEADLTRAVELMEQIEGLRGESFALTTRRAEVLLWLVEPMSDEREVVRLCREGERLASRLRELDPDRVEGYYYGALFLGLRARHQRARAAFLLDDLDDLGRRAMEIDPGYDDAGPLRFMGMLLLSAPAWPHGIGDPEGGVELLERAVAVSEYPLNRVLLARGLVEIDDDEAACEALTDAFSAPSEGRWALTRDRWRPEAEQLAARISCPLRALPGIARAQ